MIICCLCCTTLHHRSIKNACIHLLLRLFEMLFFLSQEMCFQLYCSIAGPTFVFFANAVLTMCRKCLVSAVIFVVLISCAVLVVWVGFPGLASSDVTSAVDFLITIAVVQL